MIDIHCHILPGMDDGPSTLKETFAMAREAAKAGVEKIIATPHHLNGTYLNESYDIIGAVNYLNVKLNQENIPIQVLPGQEIRIYEDLVKDLIAGRLLTLNETTRYVSLELPESHVPNYMTQLLYEMQLAGYIPIISNPERNLELLKSPEKLYRLVKNGAFTQLAASSLVGMNGKQIQKFSKQIIQANLVHFLCSNAHNSKSGYYISEAMREIRKHHGVDVASRFIQNSMAIINDETIYGEEPSRITNNRWTLFTR